MREILLYERNLTREDYNLFQSDCTRTYMVFYTLSLYIPIHTRCTSSGRTQYIYNTVAEFQKPRRNLLRINSTIDFYFVLVFDNSFDD